MTRRRSIGAEPTAEPTTEPTTDTLNAGVADQSPADTSLGQHVRAFDVATQGGETRRGRSRRMARRTRLHGYALFAVALFAFVIALAATNTARVKVNWLFGSSHVSLVWLVLAAAILGWLLGLVTNAALHRRTSAPRPASRL
ncbi:MAG TPA: LapA family protein [Solirubrobacteraceae bacterium]|nr:LapA family protein [Solirubrobacteraceae bacterium]